MSKRKRTPEQLARATSKRAVAEAARKARDKAAADSAEFAAEQIAPAAQRHSVIARNGVMVRGPRVEACGLTFVRSNPLRHLAARSAGMEVPTIHDGHLRAAARLLAAWETGADGIGSGASNYQPRSGAVQSGIIAEGLLTRLNAQIAARDQIDRAQRFLAGLWPVIHAVVIEGIDASSWASSVGMDRKVAMGYLAAALDMLVTFYAPKPVIRSNEALTATGRHA